MDSFEEYTKKACEYAKARGCVAAAFTGEYENHKVASLWLDYFATKGWRGAVNTFRRHLEAGRAITVPCTDPSSFDYTFEPRYPKDWRPKPFPARSAAERRALLVKLGLRYDDSGETPQAM